MMDENKEELNKSEKFSSGLNKKEEDEKVLFDFTVQAQRFEIFARLERLVGSQRIESHKHLLDWVLQKWRNVAGKYENTKLVESKSDIVNDRMQITDNDTKKGNDPDLERKRLAAERRKKIMEQMAKAQ